MKKTVFAASKILFAVGVVGIGALALQSIAAGPVGPGSGCPRRGIYCLDVYRPVECTTRFGTRAVFSNDCYAYVACATNCTDASSQ